MPEGILVNGSRTVVPGIFADPDASALATEQAPQNRLAIVGEFPFIAQNTPAVEASADGLRELQFSDVQLRTIADKVFSPANDPAIQGSPERVLLVNVLDSSQANKTFQDTKNSDSLELKSKTYGISGNRVKVLIEQNANVASAFDITIKRDGREENFTKVESGAVVDFEYTGAANSDIQAVSMRYDPTQSLDGPKGGGNEAILRIKQTLQVSDATVDPDLTETEFDSRIGIKIPNNGSSQQNDFEITGTLVDGTTGATETISVPAGNSTIQYGSKHFVEVTNIDAKSGNDGDTNNYDNYQVIADAFNIANNDFGDVDKLADHVNSGDGYSATVQSPKAPKIETDKVDLLDDGAGGFTSIDGSAKTLRADLRAIRLELRNSTLVTPSRASGAKRPPATFSNFKFLTGGQDDAGGGSDWTGAFQALRQKSAQVVVPFTTSAADVDKADDHALHMAGKGADERQVWAGMSSGATLSSVTSRAKGLNSRHTALVFQDSKIRLPDGSTEVKTPEWTALILAAMQTSSPLATPLTRKKPDVLEVQQNANIDLFTDDEELISNGVVMLRPGDLGARVVRSVTTYLEDDNPVWSEVSAVESINASIRDLRAQLNAVVGDPNISTTVSRVKSIVNTRLRTQVTRGIINDFDPSSVKITDTGSKMKVKYDAVPTFPVNFVSLEPTLLEAV